MTEAIQGGPSLFQYMKERIGNPIDWTNADRCLVASTLTLFIVTPYFGWLFYVLKHPAKAPYLDYHFLEIILPIAFILFVGGWLAIVVASLWSRRRAPDTRLLVNVLAQFYVGTMFYAVYLWGMYTSPQIIVILGGFFVGFLLFDKGPMLGALASLAVLYVGATVVEQAGLIPYAPMMAGSPYEEGHLAPSWLASYGAINTVTLALLLGLVYFIFYRWRDQEEQLSRANELISRYVAAQVIERIFKGDYDSVNKHARRKLTVFFSDIKDFTATTERMEAEDLSEILNEYLTEMTHIAEKYGGTIDKFVGDAIMIFFGAPGATSDQDHALRAVRMAVEMQQRMETLREEWRGRGIQLPFHVRMGVNTGQASIGNFGSEGRMDYTAIGRQVNLAARLEVNCEPDRVLISHSTWALVNEEIPCIAKGEITAKGVRDPVKVYEVAPGQN